MSAAAATDELLSHVRVRCPRGHEVVVIATKIGWARTECSDCGSAFEYVADVKCVRSTNNNDSVPGKKRRFEVKTTVTFRTPEGGSEQQRMALQDVRSERGELVHLRGGNRFACSRGRTGVYYVENYTIGEHWNLLRWFSWMTVAARALPILCAAWLAAAVVQDLLWAVIVGLVVAVVLYVRYGRCHAMPL